MLTKFKPVTVRGGIGIEKLDEEGRVLTLEFDEFYLVAVNTPYSHEHLKRLWFRVNIWDPEF